MRWLIAGVNKLTLPAIMRAQKSKKYMTTFENFVKAAVEYIDKHGEKQTTIDKLETMLPGAWAAEVIAEALDEIQAR
jgi:hypothetical protein